VTLSWEKHIPIMYSFWGSVLLGQASYSGNPLLKHLELDRLSALGKVHFDRWLELWERTVQENFSGEKAVEAVKRAKAIAGVMLAKIEMNRAA
jgi:hemoglobin